jgi:hypothetical protein
MDQIDLTQDKDRWQAVVNAVMNCWVPHNVMQGIFGLAEDMLAFQGSLCSME